MLGDIAFGILMLIIFGLCVVTVGIGRASEKIAEGCEPRLGDY